MIRLYVHLDKNFKGDLVDKGVIKKSMAATMKEVHKVFLAALRASTPVGIATTSPKLRPAWRTKQRGAYKYSFINPMSYAYIVDEGRFRGIGPRTVRGPVYPPDGRGIFSSQAPRGITYPYGEEQGTDADWIDSVVKRKFNEFYREFRGKK